MDKAVNDLSPGRTARSPAGPRRPGGTV